MLGCWLCSDLASTDLGPMSIGLSHSLSRYKLKFSPDKVCCSLNHWKLLLNCSRGVIAISRLISRLYKIMHNQQVTQLIHQQQAGGDLSSHSRLALIWHGFEFELKIASHSPDCPVSKHAMQGLFWSAEWLNNEHGPLAAMMG